MLPLKPFRAKVRGTNPLQPLKPVIPGRSEWDQIFAPLKPVIPGRSEPGLGRVKRGPGTQVTGTGAWVRKPQRRWRGPWVPGPRFAPLATARDDE